MTEHLKATAASLREEIATRERLANDLSERFNAIGKEFEELQNNLESTRVYLRELRATLRTIEQLTGFVK